MRSSRLVDTLIVIVIFLLLAAIFGSLIWWLEIRPARLEKEKDLKWRQELSEVTKELARIGPRLISGYPSAQYQFSAGGWLVVNESDWLPSEENKKIEGRAHPKIPADVAYVLVVSPATRKSAGYWKYQGGSHSEQRFVSEYTTYLIDWRQKKLIRKEVLTSPNNPGGKGFWGGWEENQKKPRPIIVYSLAGDGAIVKLTSLDQAARKGNLPLMKYYIDMGVDLKNSYVNNHVIMVALNYRQPEIVRLLLEKGVKSNIFIAAGLGDITHLKQMISLKPKLVNTFSRNGMAPLHYAAAFGHIDTAQYLLDNGANINASRSNYDDDAGFHLHGPTPLQIAQRYNQKETAEFLLKNGADPNIKGD